MRRQLPTVVTYNCGNARDALLVDDLTRLVIDGAQVIGLQEASDRGFALLAFRRLFPSWRIYRARFRPGGKATPILWNAAAVSVTARRAPRAVGRTWVGPKGSGPTHSKTKRVLQIDAQLLAGGPVVTIGNTHFIPSAGRTDLPSKEISARRSHYRLQAHAVIRAAEQAGHPFILTADMNADPDSLLVRPLHNAGFNGWHNEATHGARAIDQVLSTGGARKRSAVEIFDFLSSDHSAVMRRFYVNEEAPA